jgi:ferric-dicitrate binding protein FerR (iron transport regulator)
MVKKNERFVYLNPGQQAVLQPGQEDFRVNNGVDVEEVVAWKNGHFKFNSADIGGIMRQVARWYDVDVIYEKTTSETFSGGLPRSEHVSELLKMLEATRLVNFELKGKQILVKPR